MSEGLRVGNDLKKCFFWGRGKVGFLQEEWWNFFKKGL